MQAKPSLVYGDISTQTVSEADDVDVLRHVHPQKQPAGGEHSPLLQQYPHHDGRPRLGASVLDMVRVIVNYGCPLEKLDDVKCVCHSTLRLAAPAPPAAGHPDVDPGVVVGDVRGPPWCRRWRWRGASGACTHPQTPPSSSRCCVTSHFGPGHQSIHFVLDFYLKNKSQTSW